VAAWNAQNKGMSENAAIDHAEKLYPPTAEEAAYEAELRQRNNSS